MFVFLFLVFWLFLLGVKVVLPPPDNFMIHGIFHWMVVFLEFSLGALLFTRWAFQAAVGLIGFFFFGGVLLVLFPPGRPCGCLGAIRIGDGVHMLLLGFLGAASLVLACELKGICPMPLFGKSAQKGVDSMQGRDPTGSYEGR